MTFRKWHAGRIAVFAALLLAGALLRILYCIQFSASPLYDTVFGADVSEYYKWALRILSGELIPPEAPIHAPLYPWVLAALLRICDLSIPAVRMVQLGLNYLAFIALYFLLERRLRGEERPAVGMIPMLFLGIAMLYAPLFYYQAELISESILIVVLTGALWTFYAAETASTQRRRVRFQIAAGAVSAAAVLIHPIALGFAGLEFLKLLRDGHREKNRFGALGFAAVFLLFLLPTVAINTRLAGRFVGIQDNSILNLYLGHNPDADGTCNLRPGRPWREFSERINAEAKALQTDRNSLMLHKIAAFYGVSPHLLPYLIGVKAVKFFSPRELISGADPEPVIRFTALQRGAALWALFLLPLSLLGLAALLLTATDRRRFLDWILLFGGFFLMQVLTVTSGRYRAAVFPALFLFAAYFFARAIGGEYSRRTAFGFAAGGVLLYGAMTAGYVLPDYLTAQVRQESALLYGVARAERKEFREALREFTAAREFSGDPVFHAVDIGKCHAALGNSDAARREFAQAIAEDKAAATDAMVNLANLHSEAKQDAEAAQLYATALRRKDANANAYYNFGVFLIRHREWDKAVRAFLAALELDPSHAESLNMLGVIALRDRQYDSAVSSFAAAARLKPNDPRYLGNLVIALRNSNRVDELRRAERKLKQLLGPSLNSRKEKP